MTQIRYSFKNNVQTGAMKNVNSPSIHEYISSQNGNHDSEPFNRPATLSFIFSISQVSRRNPACIAHSIMLSRIIRLLSLAETPLHSELNKKGA